MENEEIKIFLRELSNCIKGTIKNIKNENLLNAIEEVEQSIEKHDFTNFSVYGDDVNLEKAFEYELKIFPTLDGDKKIELGEIILNSLRLLELPWWLKNIIDVLDEILKIALLIIKQKIN